MNHGNAWSVYFRDPEGNRIEIFCDTEWYIEQPCVEDLDSVDARGRNPRAVGSVLPHRAGFPADQGISGRGCEEDRRQISLIASKPVAAPTMTSPSSATGRSAPLANLLGLSGLKVAVLEREPSLYHMPRAVSLDGEGMRLFQTIGLADKLLPKLNVSRNIRHVNAEGKLLLLIARGGIGPDGWNHAYRFYQPELEGVLREGVARFANVEVRLRYDVFALDEGDDTSACATRISPMATLSALTARYVVGCDGARSTVRRFMGAALQDLRSHERWIVLDMILDKPPAGVPEAADESGKSWSMRSSIAIRRGRRPSCRCRASATAGSSC